MKVSEAARRLKLSEKTVLLLCATGALKAEKLKRKAGGLEWDLIWPWEESEGTFTAKRLAGIVGLSATRIRFLCARGAIPGARRLGGQWFIPMVCAAEYFVRPMLGARLADSQSEGGKVQEHPRDRRQRPESVRQRH